MLVRAKSSAVLHLDGNLVPVKEGDPFETTDDVVKAHPHMFAADSDQPSRRRGGKVEQATAAPGEQRDL